MVSRVYSVDRADGKGYVGYKGFDQRYLPSEMEVLAVVVWEGEAEVYVLDDTAAARVEFNRFITDEAELRGGEPEVRIAGIYRRGK